MRNFLVFVFLVFVLCATEAASALQAPSKKPAPPYASTVLSRADAKRLAEGLEAARDGNWSLVEARLNAMNDRDARLLLLWRMASSTSSNISFDLINRARTELSDWPDPRTIAARAEDLISVSALSSSARINWFSDNPPISGEGKAHYGDLLVGVGQRDKGHDLIRSAWTGHPIHGSRSTQILRDHGAILSTEDHIARVEYLLWTGQRSAANRLKRYLPSGHQKLVTARIALAGRGRGVDALINAVPSELSDNAGLLYERSKWRRKRGRWDDALAPLLQIKPDDAPDVGERVIWNEKNLHVRRAIKAKDYQTAYALSATNGLSSGIEFAEAEWNAGWLALRKLGNPQLALQHFVKLGANVSTPISKSRALFWQGEAHTALGETDAAREAYIEAAKFKYTFYGQLAAERVSDRTIVFNSITPTTDDERATFEERTLVRVLKMLAENGEDYFFRKFAFHLDDQLATEWEHQLLYELAYAYNQPHVGIRGAKAGLARGYVAPDAAYPLLTYEVTRPSTGVEDALVLALSRQESELNPRAVSHANARGLMQLLPRTAQYQARREGLPFRTSWLTDDPGYNITLGSAHLEDLLEQFDGSYIMSIAAYNAGASRPKRWVTEYGDPRYNEIDPVDWVESIPFSETRSYVQRVLENVQVYRHRLSGEPTDIRLSEDLRRGGP